MGRNRKSGTRYPSGKLKPAAKPTAEPISGALYQRIRTDALKLGADPRMASELSRLNLFGELTIVQTTAGHRVAEIYGSYEALAGLRRSTRSPSYERAFGGTLADSAEREYTEKKATIAFLELQQTLALLLPSARAIERGPWNERHIPLHPLTGALEELCVENRAINPTLYPGIRAVLEHLAQWWGLSVKRRSAGSAKRPTGTTPAKGEAPAPKKVNLDRQSWIETIRAMRPDLTPEQAGEAYDLAQALKQRAVFVNSKPSLRRPAPPTSHFRVAADRPTLTLVKKGGNDAA